MGRATQIGEMSVYQKAVDRRWSLVDRRSSFVDRQSRFAKLQWGASNGQRDRLASKDQGKK
jgi:hypothetical protein